MWVEGGDIHDELLDQLGSVLTEPSDLALAPSPAELQALAAAVAARWPEGATAPAAVSPRGTPDPGSSVRPLRSRRPMRRLGSSAWRAGSVAAGIVLFSASAAAASGGVALPRPVRVVAYTVGLPVDSPALDDTNQHIEELKEAVEANDKPKAEATARRLQTDLRKVPGHEKKEAAEKVEAVMAIAQPLVAPTSTTTTTAPAPPAVGAPAAPSSSTATTATTAEVEDGDKPKDKDKEKGSVTTTTAPPSTTTTTPESTTTTTAPETDETPSDGTPAGDPGTGSGDPGTGDPGTGGGDPGSTTPTTTPDDGTTPTTIPDDDSASGASDPGATTTTTTSTTTTTMPPADPGGGNQP